MTRARAIAKHCFECAGNSHKEVTLCHIFDCPLWEYRTGQSLKSKAYQHRMRKAVKRYAKELKELEAEGISVAPFSQ